MAAPFVSGTVALLRAKFPGRSVNDIESALIDQPAKLVDPISNRRYPELDALASYTALGKAKPLPARPAVATSTKQVDLSQFQRVIVTAGINRKPSDTVSFVEKGFVTEKKISPTQFSVTAPAKVVNDIRAKMTVHTDSLAGPN